MKIKFWGTRGSLPSPLTAAQVREKIMHALLETRGTSVPMDEVALGAWVDQNLPFHVRGTCGGNTSCVEILRSGEEYVLLDAGTGLRDFAHHYKLQHSGGTHPGFPVGGVFHLFMTHMHWDHVQGLPFFYPMYASGQSITIYGVHSNLEEAMRAQFRTPFFPVPYEYLKAKIVYKKLTPGETYEVAGLKITLYEQNHPGTSYGYRFEENGRVFVYSTDFEHKSTTASAPDYPPLKFFADADLLVFDAMYSLDEATYIKADWGHSSNVTGVELAARARVKRLALFHHEPLRTDAELNQMLFSTRMYAELFHQEKGHLLHGPHKYPAEVILAYDGLVVEL